ncbi:MAG TPA: XdhC family protein [Acidimicrobiia bacterium]
MRSPRLGVERRGRETAPTVVLVYGVAITVAACLQSGTRADVAWLVAADGVPVPDWSDAVVFTPGGGRIGELLGGALDGKLGDLAGRAKAGRLVDAEITEVDALIAGLGGAGRVRCLLAPAETLPGAVWDLAMARGKFCLVTRLDGDEVTGADVYSEATLPEAEPWVREAYARGPGSAVSDETVVSTFSAVPQMIVVGAGDIAEALADLAGVIGWQARLVGDLSVVSGLITPLSARDKVVIAAHDLELAGAALAAALESQAGYIGSVGSRKMQEDRADWLAYRGVTDLARVHGPAGLDIGADSPGEIAVAIAAEAIAETPR